MLAEKEPDLAVPIELRDNANPQ